MEQQHASSRKSFMNRGGSARSRCWSEPEDTLQVGAASSRTDPLPPARVRQ